MPEHSDSAILHSKAPAVSRRERKKGRTRADIYNAAMTLFLKRGFDSVTIEDICDAADVARATFFLHFPAKETLLVEYGDRANAELAGAIREYHGSATLTLRMALKMLAERAQRHPDVVRMMVREVIARRLPRTLELILAAMVLSVLVGIPLGVWTAVRKTGIADRAVFAYGMLAGALPDFWFALIMIFLFFFQLGWAPGPIGQLDLTVSIPPRVTGMYAVDAFLVGDWPAFRSGLAHLVLPVTTLTAIYMPLVMKNTRSTMEEMLDSEFVAYARAAGLSRAVQLRYALRNSMPSVVTIVGILFWFLLGGAVLVETVFAWGGLGQYAVQSVVSSDYAPLQAFVLVTAVFTSIVFLLVDLGYFLLDPRIKP